MNRRNQILLGILVVQVFLIILVFWPRPASSGPGGPLLANFKASDVVDIQLSDDSGNQLQIAKQGDNWVLPQADAYPADASKITPFLSKLENLRTNRLVTQTEASHKRLKVADNDFNRKIEVKLSDGSSHTVFVGSSAGGTATHVRAGGQAPVYLSDQLRSWEVDATAGGWIDPVYFTVTQTATLTIALQNPQGLFEFERSGEQWAMKGLAATETLNENNVTSLLSQASSVRMSAPIGKTEQESFGLKQPLAVITLTTKTEAGEVQTHTLRIGSEQSEPPKTEGGQETIYYVAASSDSPYFVRLASWSAETFINKKRDDFIQPPPTPTPGAAPTAALPGLAPIGPEPPTPTAAPSPGTMPTLADTVVSTPTAAATPTATVTATGLSTAAESPAPASTQPAGETPSAPTPAPTSEPSAVSATQLPTANPPPTLLAVTSTATVSATTALP